MEIVKKNRITKHKNSDTCKANAYLMKNKDVSGAVVTISGRYPEKGRVVNKKCQELVFILKGSGKAVVEGETVKLAKNDLILIEPKERYYWDGKFTLFVASDPSWYPEQHKKVK